MAEKERKTAAGIYIQILKKDKDKFKTQLESKNTEYNTLKTQADSTKEIYEKMIDNESEAIIDRIEYAADKELVGDKALTAEQVKELKGYLTKKDMTNYYIKEVEYKIKELIKGELKEKKDQK